MNSLDNKLITIFGGSGFVGRYVAQALLARGARLRMAQRSAQSALHIKPLGNLGQVQLASADIRKADSVARAVDGADMVVNLVGSFADMDAVQHVGAANVARAAAAAKVGALVHISAIGADSESPARYGRSKAAGEAAAIDHGLGELAQMLGNDVKRLFDRGAATAWAADPFSRGAYSHCLPGRYGARELLTRPVGERIVFAGEHTEQAAYGTLHGAHLSGLRAARQVVELLRRA